MGAPIGNQFWKMRSKHGREKIFSEPAIMLEACYEYFRYQNDKFFLKKEAIKGGEFTGQIIDIPTITPFSFALMCSYLHVHSRFFAQFESDLKPKESETDKDFYDVITHVREIIQEQQFEGAAVGAFSTNLIARRIGLADKVNSEITGKNGGAIETNNTLNINMITGSKSLASTEKEIQEAIERELE